ncbi:MAG: GGDEF domain-containing protein [Vicinamibacteria bacterium]|nr:GGDEF domain-containing protein [Vicinamibacteria bacterium]
MLTIVALLIGLGYLAHWMHVRRCRSALAESEREKALLLADIKVLRAQVDRFRLDQEVFGRLLAILPALSREFHRAPSERQIPAMLLAAAVSTLGQRQALVLMRRRRDADTAFSVTAVAPSDCPARIGTSVEVEHRDGKYRIPAVVLEALGLDGREPWTLEPMIVDDEDVGLVALASSGPTSPSMESVVRVMADLGATALRSAAVRQRFISTAQKDELTQLLNKQHTMRLFTEELRKAQRQGSRLSLFMFDIDFFKHYNDTNGHMAGDILLRLLAQLVSEHIRAEDILGRYGGEEFLLILPGASAREALLVARKIRDLVAEYGFPARDCQPRGRLTISGGVAEFPAHGTATTALLRAADAALYEAKHLGRNRVQVAARQAPDKAAVIEEEWDES